MTYTRTLPSFCAICFCVHVIVNSSHSILYCAMQTNFVYVLAVCDCHLKILAGIARDVTIGVILIRIASINFMNNHDIVGLNDIPFKWIYPQANTFCLTIHIDSRLKILGK